MRIEGVGNRAVYFDFRGNGSVAGRQQCVCRAVLKI